MRANWILRRIISIYKKLIEAYRQLLRKKLEKMIRQIAKEEGVDPDTIVAVIKCESGMNPSAVNHNIDGTTDYGLCQFNDHWYRKLITPEEALHKPKKAVRLMCRRFREGHGKDWICFKSGLYKKFLS